MSKAIREMPRNPSRELMKLNPHIYMNQVDNDSQKDIKKSKSPELSKPRGRKPMNKTETEFARILEAKFRRNEIVSYDREGITLRWADGMTYTPDFSVVTEIHPFIIVGERTAQCITLIEVKGAWIEGDALTKFRAARANWPLYIFELWQSKKGEWTRLL